MSEKEMNAYRLNSLEEPTDEMLALLMREVAEEAKQKSEKAHKRFFKRSGMIFVNNGYYGVKNTISNE